MPRISAYYGITIWPRRAFALAAEWALLHQDELRANWERARQDEPLQQIEPLA